MNVFVWQSVEHCTDNWHSGGGVVVFAVSESRARELANSIRGCSIRQEEMPDLAVSCDPNVPERVFIMENAGCC